MEDGVRQTWHYEWCPACGVTGQVLEQAIVGDVITVTSERCQACEGTGRVKIPNGFQLLPVPHEHASISGAPGPGGTG